VVCSFQDITARRTHEALGHAAGDQAPQEIARRMREYLRASDLVARVGGDEFAVVLEGVRSRERAEEVAGNLVRAIFEPMKEPAVRAPGGGEHRGRAVAGRRGLGRRPPPVADRAMDRVKRDLSDSVDAG